MVCLETWKKVLSLHYYFVCRATCIHGLQWRDQKFKLTIFWTKVSHNVNDPILKDLCKFQVDPPINAKVTAVQSFENLHTSILRQPCWWSRDAHQTNFPYNIIKNSPTSFSRNSVFLGPNDFKFGTETCCGFITPQSPLLCLQACIK